MIATTYKPDWSFVRKYSGVYQLNPAGDVVAHYRDNIPSWVIRPYDENDFLEQGINDWGSHKKGDSFDFWASGLLWIAPSNDRLEMTEDTRYVYDSDSNQVVAMVMVHPIRSGGELSLAGAFKATPEGISYYDLRQYDLMSGIAASGVVKSKITARAGSNYFTAMELIYPFSVNNQTKYVWFVPVYYQSTNSNLIGLAGLGIVDAQSADKVVVEYTGAGVSGEKLIEQTKESFRALYATAAGTGKPTFGALNCTLVAKYDFYTKDGNTRQWLVVKIATGEREVLVRSDMLDDLTLLKIQELKKGDSFGLEVDDNGVVKNIFFFK